MNDQRIEQYLSALRSALRNASPSEQTEIIREIAAHIRDATEEPGTQVTTILSRLGAPELLARQYSDELLLQTARRSLSPWLVLRAALRLATKGMLGIVVFSFALSGYLTGIVMMLSALAKPFFPKAIGLWRPTPQSLSVGMVAAHTLPVHEVLGWWYIPLALAIGVALIFLTTLVVRGCLWVSGLANRLGPGITLAQY